MNVNANSFNRQQRRRAEKLIKKGKIVAYKDTKSGDVYFESNDISKYDLKLALMRPGEIHETIEKDILNQKNLLL
jgi:hypothetical protein